MRNLSVPKPIVPAPKPKQCKCMNPAWVTDPDIGPRCFYCGGRKP